MSKLPVGFAVAAAFWSCASGDLHVVSTESVPSAPVYVVAARQKSQIEESLRGAGITLTDDLTNAAYLLRVTIGNEKGWRNCGTLNNVKFALRRDRQDILLITGSGWTGDCNPTIFGRFSEQLKESFSAALLTNSPTEEVN